MELLGLEIGGTKLQLALGDASGRIREMRRWTVAPARGADGIRQQIAEALAECCSTAKIAAVGVGFGGPVDFRTGIIRCSHQISGWKDFPLAEWLRELTSVPVRVDNDANVAALGEALAGAGRGANPVFYVTLGSGVGGGLVHHEAIYHGAVPGEAEIGHVRLDRAGTTVESRCSGWAVDARVRRLATDFPDSPLGRLVAASPGHEARHLGAALRAGDPGAHRLVEELCEDLAFGLSHVVHLFHPEVIVLGGGLAGLGEPLRAGVAAALPRFVMEAFAPGPAVRLSELGEAAVPAGALRLAAAGRESSRA